MIMAKFNVFSQVIRKGLSGAGEDAIMGKHLIITEMAHVQKVHLQCNKDAHTITVKVAHTHLMTTFNFHYLNTISSTSQ